MNHNKSIVWLSLFISVVGITLVSTGRVWAAEPQTRKVVIVTGIDYPGHKWKETAPALARELRKDTRLKVDVVETPSFLASPKLKDYDTVVLQFFLEAEDQGQNVYDSLRLVVRQDRLYDYRALMARDGRYGSGG